jgi:hypothetical protein
MGSPTSVLQAMQAGFIQKQVRNIITGLLLGPHVEMTYLSMISEIIPQTWQKVGNWRVTVASEQAE